MKKERVIIIGAGNIAALFDSPDKEKILTHAHAIVKNKNLVLQGFYDTDFEKAKRAAEIWNTIAYREMEDALEEADIAVCCVPDEFHYELLKKCSEYHLKLVITEKPLTETVEEALEINKIYNHKGFALALNYSRRYLKEFQKLKDKISDYGFFLKGTGYYGKGIFHNGSHMIDILSFLLDSDCKVLNKSHAVNDFFENDQSYDVNLQVAGGIFEMKVIDCRIATVFEMDLFFEKARIRILDGGTKIEIYEIKESTDYAGYYNYMISEEWKIDYSGALSGLYDNIVNHLKSREKLLCSVDDGIRVLKICTEVTR